MCGNTAQNNRREREEKSYESLSSIKNTVENDLVNRIKECIVLAYTDH